MIIPKEIKEGIIEWNKSRDNNTFDLNLEMKMLIEEANEYYTSIKLVDRFDALLDYAFVYIGSEWKHNRSGFKHQDFIEFSGSLLDTIVRDLKYRFFMERISNFQMVFNEGMRIVLGRNNKKSNNKDKDGKIIKPKDFVGPEEQLRKLIEEYRIK